MSQNRQQEQQGITVNPSLAIRWRKSNANEDFQTSNHLTFQIIESLEEHHASTRESHDAHSQDFLYLDAKLSLLIDLVGQLLSQQNSPPQTRQVSLSVSGMQWITNQAPAPDENIVTELFLDKRHGGSIQLPATVVSVEGAGTEQRVRVVFEALDDSTRQHLEKWIFRAHRREIASKRQH